MSQQESLSQGPLILADHADARYVQLGVRYTLDTDYFGSIKRTEAAYDGEQTVIYRLHSDEAPVKCCLSDEEFVQLVAGRLRYLIDHGMAVQQPLLEEAFTAYVHACEEQARASVLVDDDLGDLDVHPF
jgi:hypothetical protein